MLVSCSASGDKVIGQYGFLVDSYSGDSIECIAYIDDDTEYGMYIEKIYTKFGYTILEEEVLLKDNKSESICLGNYSHSLGFTHETDFNFVQYRDATEKDFMNISERPNLLDKYYVSFSNNEYTLHYSDSSCTSKNNVMYITTFSESSLLKAGFCDKCFPEMYYEDY